MYRHKPAGTLKNISPMIGIMNDIIFCIICCCSSAALGMNNFCCAMNKIIVAMGKMLKKGPSQPVSSASIAGIQSFQ